MTSSDIVEALPIAWKKLSVFFVDFVWVISGGLGSRITGGGFGGCTVCIVKDEAVDTFIETIGKAYAENVGHEAEFYTVDIGDGASRLA